MEHSLQQEFEEMVHEKMMQNCPIMPYDVRNAYKLFGPDLSRLKGKTVQRKPLRIQLEYVQIPPELIEQNKLVTLMEDIMFMNQIPFIITYGWDVGLITVEWIPNHMGK